MDGGFFLCPDAWEFLLPAEIRHLRDAGSVCRKRWDLLTLTPMGCALLPDKALRNKQKIYICSYIRHLFFP